MNFKKIADTSLNSVFYIFIAFCSKFVFKIMRCHCCWFGIILNTNFEQRFLHVLYPFYLLFHSHHILNINLMHILATSLALFTLTMASCMWKPNFIDKNLVSDLCFFVKIATMFKLLVYYSSLHLSLLHSLIANNCKLVNN